MTLPHRFLRIRRPALSFYLSAAGRAEANVEEEWKREAVFDGLDYCTLVLYGMGVAGNSTPVGLFGLELVGRNKPESEEGPRVVPHICAPSILGRTSQPPTLYIPDEGTAEDSHTFAPCRIRLRDGCRRNLASAPMPRVTVPRTIVLVKPRKQ